jgi:hypothetical protein
MGDRVVVLWLKAVDLSGRKVRIPEKSLLHNCIVRREESGTSGLRELGPYVVAFEYAQHTWHAPLYSFLARTSAIEGLESEAGNFAAEITTAPARNGRIVA